MQMSAEGLADLELHEGVVLRAYRDPVGVWTIGAGLTKNSGVVTPRAGMALTKSEATGLLLAALKRNYEPRVTMAMPGAKQHEFDAGAGFDYNTGAIFKASWVKAWLKRDWPDVQRRLAQWRKGGGRVLPGLVRRREAEYQLMRYGRYASTLSLRPKALSADSARITLNAAPSEIAAMRAGFHKLGFPPGPVEHEIATQAIIAFQKQHDLTVDGILGRATLATLQRQLDARAKAGPAAGGVAVSGGAAVTVPEEVLATLPAWAPSAAMVLAGLYALWLAWRYRDAVAAAVQSPLPRVAAYLRSF